MTPTAVPLLPGTRAIYNVSGSCFTWVGFLGYAGGLEASAVSEERDFASTMDVDMGRERITRRRVYDGDDDDDDYPGLHCCLQC